MKTIKILYSGESTGAASGFGIYGHNILSRLVKNPRFHIAEFASFGSINDYKFANAKWRYYPNAVDDGHPDKQAYESNMGNKFGAWRYERVLLDFQPDIVFTIRDPWMMEHEHKSPLRQFYNLVIMPTVDSAPQQHPWIEMFASADALFTYSDWAIPVLAKQSNNRIKSMGSPYAGVEFESFYASTNKKADKEKFGLPPDSYIIGTVMRNQKRKLIEDLFKAFQIYLQQYGNTEIGKKTFLLVHTSFPDFAGWNLPKLLKEYGIANKVYFSYLCQHTKQLTVHKFAGTRAFSPATQSLTGAFPNVGTGVTRDQLGDLYRTMDLYVQYAICEGLGMPQVEAAACGVPVAAVNYSAMADVVSKTHGIPIEIDRMFYEWETNAFRAYPNNTQAAHAFYKFLSSEPKYKQSKSNKAIKAAHEFFNWDRSAKMWSDYFESVVLKGNQGNWRAPSTLVNPHIPPYTEMQCSNSQYVEWLCNEVAKNPDSFFCYIGLDCIEQLNNGMSSTHKGGGPINRKQMYDAFAIMGNNKIICENARQHIDGLPMQDFISFAHHFEQGLK